VLAVFAFAILVGAGWTRGRDRAAGAAAGILVAAHLAPVPLLLLITRSARSRWPRDC
jgi:hypothetical protein